MNAKSGESALDQLQDGEVVALVGELSREITAAVDFETKPLVDSLIQEGGDIGEFVSWGMTHSEMSLTAENSVVAARELLRALTKHPVLGPYIEERAESFSDSRMMADIILSVGAAASMIFFAVSTSVQITYNETESLKVSINKGVTARESIEAVMSGLGKAIAAIKP